MTDSLAADFASLDGVRVFFGHQSVGENILDGLRALAATAGREIAVAPLGEQLPAAGGIVHAKVGRNEHPETKCDAFRDILDERPDLADVALLKFCYIDITERTDVDVLFETYRSTLDGLDRRHPSLAIVPVTAPLRHAPGGLGVFVRERLGRPNRAKMANAHRHAFNERVRRAWADRPIFDLAAAEATRPDGGREQFRWEGATCDNLVAAYTDDGGHLNAAGRAASARAFLRCLASVAAARLR